MHPMLHANPAIAFYTRILLVSIAQSAYMETVQEDSVKNLGNSVHLSARVTANALTLMFQEMWCRRGAKYLRFHAPQCVLVTSITEE